MAKYEVHAICFQTFFVWAFKIVLDSWKVSMLLLYILWNGWPIFMISGSNKQLQQQLEYTLLKPDCHSWWISKMQSGRGDTLEKPYGMELCLKLGKNATETFEMLQTAFGTSCINRASVFEWHKRFKEGRESARDDERCGRSKEVRTPEMIGQIKNVMDKDRRVSIETKSAQFDVSVGTVHTIILEELKMQKICANFVPRVLIFVTVYLTKMGIKTAPHPPYSPDLAPCEFFLFPKLKEKVTGCRYETIEKFSDYCLRLHCFFTTFRSQYPPAFLRSPFFIRAYVDRDLVIFCIYWETFLI